MNGHTKINRYCAFLRGVNVKGTEKSTVESEFGKISGSKNLKNAFTFRNLNAFEKVFLKKNSNITTLNNKK